MKNIYVEGACGGGGVTPCKNIELGFLRPREKLIILYYIYLKKKDDNVHKSEGLKSDGRTNKHKHLYL